jgi:hypothetical protein
MRAVVAVRRPPVVRSPRNAAELRHTSHGGVREGWLALCKIS